MIINALVYLRPMAHVCELARYFHHIGVNPNVDKKTPLDDHYYCLLSDQNHDYTFLNYPFSYHKILTFVLVNLMEFVVMISQEDRWEKILQVFRFQNLVWDEFLFRSLFFYHP